MKIKLLEVEQPSDPSVKFIQLTRGQIAIVDAEDYERLMRYNWNAHWARSVGNFYAARCAQINGKKTYFSMHREIMNAPKGIFVDHRDRTKTLDNRKSNLRFANRTQNCANRKKHSNNTSGYIGVFKVRYKYRAQIPNPTKNPKYIHGGYFSCPIEAAKARDVIALRVFGEFAHLNFPVP